MAVTNFDEDEILGKAYDGRLMRRLGVFVQPHWRRIAVAMALLFGAALAELAPPYLTRVAIDGPIAAHDVGGVLPIVLLDIGALLLAFACRYGQTYIMQATGQQVMVDIRMRIFSHIQRMSLSFFDRNPVGRLITRLTNDVDALNEFLTQGLVELLGDSAKLVFIVITMLILNWRLALISLIIMPFVAAATFFFQRAMRAAFRAVRQRLARINAYLNEQITGILVTQLFNREDRSRIRFDELSRDYRAAQFRSVRAFAIFFPIVSFLGITATALLLNLGGQIVLGGLATIGLLVAFIQYTDQTFQPIRNMAENYNTLQSAMASSERIFRILDTPEDVTDTPQPCALPHPVHGEVEFKDVWFSYATNDQRQLDDGVDSRSSFVVRRSSDEWVLRGISFRIPRASTTSSGDRLRSMAWTSARCARASCGATSARCRRILSASAGRSPATSGCTTRRSATSRCAAPPRSPTPRRSSSDCPAATTTRCASAVRISRSASGNCWRSPARSPSTPRCC